MDLKLIVASVVLCGAGIAIISYRGVARLYYLPMGRQYSADFSLLQGIAYIAIIGSLYAGFITSRWYGLAAVLIGGHIFSVSLISLTRHKTQTIAPIALVLAAILTIIWLP